MAFLPIPKSEFCHVTYVVSANLLYLLASRQHRHTPAFQQFCQQLYHACLARIFAPLKRSIMTAKVVWCPDGHFCHAIYGLGLYIADYPEQVWLAGIVQGWCPKYVFSYCTSVNAIALIINLDVMLHRKTWMFLMPTIVLMKRLIFLSIVSIPMLSGVNLVYEVMLWYGHIYIFVDI